MCPEVDSASKNEYQHIPGGKDGRCVRVRVNVLSVQKFWSLNLPENPKATRPVTLPFTRITAVPSPKYDFKIKDENRISTMLSEFHRKTRNQRKARKGKVGGYDKGANDPASA
jgi:hypothetical protein